MLHSALQMYTNSVSKSELMTDKKFFFTEEFNFSNIDKAAIAEIIFGPLTDNLMVHSVPPGSPDSTGVGANKFVLDSSPKNKNNASTPVNKSAAKTPGKTPVKPNNIEVIDYDKASRLTGSVKFYDEKNKYGFIRRDGEQDVFVYDDALKEAGLTLEELKEAKSKKILVSFAKCKYRGTDGKERFKAVDLSIEKS